MALFSSKLSSLHKILQKTVLINGVRSVSGLKNEGIEVTLTKNPMPKIHEQVKSPNDIVFGKNFSDHMLIASWTKEEGWMKPKIVPYGNLSLSPALSALHYSTECFEGLKAFYGVDGKIRLFRPLENMKRMNSSAAAASLPEFDGAEYLECIKDLLRVDKDWVPKMDGCSLYIRPTFIGTEASVGVKPSNSAMLYTICGPAGPYFSGGAFNPVSLYADPKYVRAWPGGVGAFKMGGNYGPAIRIQGHATAKGCDQVLWLYGDDHQITEVGTMNIFVHWINEDGDPEIATPPLDGTILPGVTRMSLLELGATWGTHKVVERRMNMKDIIKAVEEKRMKEMFGAGTACVVCPVDRILYMDKSIHIPTVETGGEVAKRYYKELTDIQYGRAPNNDWTVTVD
ncbi:branched-chain-amino-acid aminotransferase-like [Halichondria panicea]|uniref:branched-chain-amino-acid aminotransferase-like n=1 Tax=Halichondria panicea TaxID=6063 RepID=UPI00312B51CE